MYTLHCTKRLLDRIKLTALVSDNAPGAVLGNRHITAMFWKAQLTSICNEEAILPVLMPLASSTSLAQKFLVHLAKVLNVLDVDDGFIAAQVAEMDEMKYAKTDNCSEMGIMNQFSCLAKGYRRYLETSDLLEPLMKLADT